MKTIRSNAGGHGAMLGALIAAAVLAGCGGGGGGSSPAPAPAPTTTSVPVKVIDGAIAKAVVCLDLDDNGACDAGEPTAVTAADGTATLTVLASDAGKHAVVAQVGTDAVDADHGPVTQPFVMTAPAEMPAVVSPLSTLVVAQAANAGSTAADAEILLRAVTGLSIPLTGYDYTKPIGGVVSPGATVARLVVLALQEQTKALAPAIGTTDDSGAKITAGDVRTASTSAVIAQLPALSAAANDPALATATATERAATLSTVAQTVMAASDLSASTAGALIGASKLAAQAATQPVSSAAPAASAMTRAFRHLDDATWSYRTFPGTAADNTPDSAGVRRYYDLHVARTGGITSSWGFGTSISSQDDLVWTGSGWSACPLGTRGTIKPLNANGSDYLSSYCGGYIVNRVQRSTIDISGQTMLAITQRIRQYPGGDAGVSYSQWGPVNLGLLGNATFPPGSAMLLLTHNADRMPAPAYTPSAAPVSIANAQLAAGGDARVPGSEGICPSLTTATLYAAQTFVPTTLESMMAGATGKPCIFAQGNNVDGSSLPANESWSGVTLSIGTLNNVVTRPAGTGNYYTTNAYLRVAFKGATVIWYSCLQRNVDSSVRNCTKLSEGTYVLQSVADTRMLTMTGAPPLSNGLAYERVFIERGGQIYYGYRVRPATNQLTVNLNLTATNAIFNQLRVPPVVPQ